jgi:hypothetical protein
MDTTSAQVRALNLEIARLRKANDDLVATLTTIASQTDSAWGREIARNAVKQAA